MYPNPQDVVPLPDRANLEQYKKLAKDLVKACRSGAPGAIRDWSGRWPNHAAEIVPFAEKTLGSRDCALTGAQFVIARVHGFVSWPKFAAHLEALERRSSPVSHFERAADAIVTGDAAALEHLLRDHPELVHARSTREHRSTLLHYTAANGVENYRQKTPPNIVSIATMLLDAGAEVDSEADMYAGRCTTLGLAATSVWPELAGVQNALMQLLIDRGALIDGPLAMGRSNTFVIGCLANGRLAAATYLAEHGGRVDLEGAAGIGRVDLVATHFDRDGALKPPATAAQVTAGFRWACDYGQTAVVEFLLDHGAGADAPVRADGQTGLHGAALGAHAGIVALLIARGAKADVMESTHGGTPLGWALYGWSEAKGAARERYYDVIERLVRAGAPVNPAWLDNAEPQNPFERATRADPRLLAALKSARA